MAEIRGGEPERAIIGVCEHCGATYNPGGGSDCTNWLDDEVCPGVIEYGEVEIFGPPQEGW